MNWRHGPHFSNELGRIDYRDSYDVTLNTSEEASIKRGDAQLLATM